MLYFLDLLALLSLIALLCSEERCDSICQVSESIIWATEQHHLLARLKSPSNMPESSQHVPTGLLAAPYSNQIPQCLFTFPISSLFPQENMTGKNLELKRANNDQCGPFSRLKKWESDLPKTVKEVVEIIDQEYFSLLTGTKLSRAKLGAFYRANDEYKLGLSSTGGHLDHSVLPKPLACSGKMIAKDQNSLRKQRTPHLPEGIVDAAESHDVIEFSDPTLPLHSTPVPRESMTEKDLEFSLDDDLILHATLQNCVVESPKPYNLTKHSRGDRSLSTPEVHTGNIKRDTGPSVSKNNSVKSIIRTPALVRANHEVTPSTKELSTPSTKAVSWVDEIDEAVDLAYEPEIDPDLESAPGPTARLTQYGREGSCVPVQQTKYSFIPGREAICDPFELISHEPSVPLTPSNTFSSMPTPTLPELNAPTSPVTARYVGDAMPISHTKSKSSVAYSTPSRASRNSFTRRVNDAQLLELDAYMESQVLANRPDLRARVSRANLRLKASTWPNKDMPRRMPFQTASSEASEDSASAIVPTNKTNSLPAMGSRAYQPAKKDSFAMHSGDSGISSTVTEKPIPIEEELKMIARHEDLRPPTNKQMFNPERGMTAIEFVKAEARRNEKIDREQDLQDRRDLIRTHTARKVAELEFEEAAKKEAMAKKASLSKRSYLPRMTSAPAPTSPRMEPGKKASITSSKTKTGLFGRYKFDEVPAKKPRSFSSSIPLPRH